MKFEYLTIDWTPEGKYPFFNAFLNYLGSLGWELVVAEDMRWITGYKCIFKRQIKQ